MNKSAVSVIVVALLVWAGLGTATAVRYRKSAELAAAKAADLQMDVQDLEKRVKKAENKPQTAVAPVISTIVTNAVIGADADARVAELQAALLEKDRLIASLQQGGMSNRPFGMRGGRDGGANWLDDLKQRDPKAYEEFVKRRDEGRQRAQREFAERADYFLKRDQSKMSKEQQENHQAMLALLDATWKLQEQLRTDLPADQRREVMSTMRDNMHNLGPLLATERESEIYAAGRNLGLSDAQASDFVGQMSQVIDNTSMHSFFEGMRGGPGDGRGGPGGGGGGGGSTGGGGGGR